MALWALVAESGAVAQRSTLVGLAVQAWPLSENPRSSPNEFAWTVLHVERRGGRLVAERSSRFHGEGLGSIAAGRRSHRAPEWETWLVATRSRFVFLLELTLTGLRNSVGIHDSAKVSR